MRSTRVGLLLVLIPTIGSAAFLVADWAQSTAPPPPAETIEAQEPPADASDDTHTQAPAQPQSDGEIIGVPLLA